MKLSKEYALKLAKSDAIHAQKIRSIIGVEKYAQLLEEGIFLTTREMQEERKLALEFRKKEVRELRVAIRVLIRELQDYKNPKHYNPSYGHSIA